jgi:hypothetical protein
MNEPTHVTSRTLSVRGSRLGPQGQLPPLAPVRPQPLARLSEQAPPSMRERVERGRLPSPLPYALFSDYDRGDHQLELPALELSNGAVTATVLPTLGGRVWSLVDHTRDRELLFVNPRLRFANFGLTDAWFAGGIEWNLGSTGHTTMSTRPVHAAGVDGPDGPVLRLWEWERTRDLVLQVDLWLDGARLLASTRVVNPDPEPKPLYYWTNIAVPETDGTRVLVPAKHAWRTDYSGLLDRLPVPHPDSADVDVSRPSASAYAADYFYEVGDQRGRVVCAVEPDGRGLAQTSTDALTGRKLFLWGTGPGGRRWQEWLGTPTTRYAEIQAGVCPTQLEHDLLDGHASRSWTECFTALDLEPEVVAGDYGAASDAAARAVHETAPPEWLEERHAHWLAEVADLDPGEPAWVASGWGAAELALRGQSSPAGMPFPPVDDESAPLRRYAEGRDVAALDAVAADHPTIPPVSERWRAAWGEAAAAPRAGWWVHLAMAVGHHVRAENEAAHAAYLKSVGHTPTATALRGLALVAGDDADADELFARATALDPGDRRLATERLVRLYAAGRDEELLTLAYELPEPIRDHGRTRLLVAQALAATGREQEALEVLEDLEVADLAEGDNSTSDLWVAVGPGEPVPPTLDLQRSQVTPGGDGR